MVKQLGSTYIIKYDEIPTHQAGGMGTKMRWAWPCGTHYGVEPRMNTTRAYFGCGHTHTNGKQQREEEVVLVTCAFMVVILMVWYVVTIS